MTRPRRALLIVPLLLGLGAGATQAAGPHQHGVAQLDVGVEPGRVVLELSTPLDNLLGFERAPRTDAERERAAAAVKKLQAAEQLFRIDPAAGCTLAKVVLTSAALGLGVGGEPAKDKGAGEPAKDKGAGEPARGDHADLDGHFEFTCKVGAKAGFVEVGLFDAFAPLKRIELQVVTPRGQLKAVLVRPSSRVVLAR